MYTARKRGVGTVICLEPKAREGVLRHVKGGKGARAQLGSEHHRSLHVFLSPPISQASRAATPAVLPENSEWLKKPRGHNSAKNQSTRSRARQQTHSSPSDNPSPPCSPEPWPWRLITCMCEAGPRHQGSTGEAWGASSSTQPCSLSC